MVVGSIVIGFVFDLFYIISGIIGICAIGIVFWDHFIDDRLLTKQVQSFYEDIENLIFTRYKHAILNVKKNLEEQYHEKWNEIEKIEKIHCIDNEYYNNIIKQKFDEYAIYLGLTRIATSYYLVNFYIHGDKYLVNNSGLMLINHFHKNNLSPSVAFLVDKRNTITEKEVNVMIVFLKNLRNYWKENYSKRKIFRGNLKSNIDFKELINR